MNLVRVEDVLRENLRFIGAPPTDAEIRVKCPGCGEWQPLAECAVEIEADETAYLCPMGCQRIVVVGTPGGVPWPGRGYRLGRYTIRNAGDLTFNHVFLPASLAALDLWPRPSLGS